MACREYAHKYGHLPHQKGEYANETLQVFFDEKIIEDNEFTPIYDAYIAYYVQKTGEGYSSNCPGNTVIFAMPFKADGSINTEVLGNQFVVMRADGSATSYPISDSGKIIDYNGKAIDLALGKPLLYH